MWGWLWRLRHPRRRDVEDKPVQADPREAWKAEIQRRELELLHREIEQAIERLQAKVDVHHRH